MEWPGPYQVSWSQLRLRPLVMEKTLLLLLCVGAWAEEQPNLPTTMPTRAYVSLVPENSETTNLNSVASSFTLARDPEKNDNARQQTTWKPSFTTYVGTEEEAFPETSIDVSTDPKSASTISQEISNTKSTVFLEISNTTSSPAVSIATNSLGPHAVTDEGLVTTFLKPMEEISGPPVTTATDSLESTNGTSESPITMATSSLDTSSGTSGLPVTMATSSLDTSDETSELPVAIATSSLAISDETSGSLVTMTTSFVETSQGTSGSPISRVKISTETTSKTSLDVSNTPSLRLNPGTNGSLLIPVLVTLLVVIVLVALLLLWRQRQKRRTGALTLNRGGKRNGVVDAWAGPAPISDEEAMTTTVGVSGDEKSSRESEDERPGHQPALTTFFGRRKSCLSSLALEELKAGSAPGLKGEIEPLVGNQDETVEAPASGGPQAGEAAASE